MRSPQEMLKGEYLKIYQEVTPTLDTSAYASGDRLGSIMTIAMTDLSMLEQGGAPVLDCLTVIDKAKQSQAIDIMFFDELPTVASADNQPIDISDAEMADKCLGSISILAADYKALANNSYACQKDIRLPLRLKVQTLYALMVCRSGTPTYAASDLVLKLTLSCK